MNRQRAQVFALASLAIGTLVSARASAAAALVEVNRSDWAGSVKLPSYMQMYIYVPQNVAAKPPIMVSSHSCGSTATGQLGNIPLSKAAADANGFILILPDNPGQNCWDVGTTASLTHDGGGDTQGVAQMVKYALMKYNGDPGRVYAMGGSGGGMMTQALMAVYPDVFRAGSARAGVPAGCWSDGYASSNQWSNNCANGVTSKTAQQWGDLVRGMYPGYTGHRPRLQTMQGEADETISYKNTGEAIKEWTNVLALPTTPTSTDTGYKAANATYDRQFWANSCGFNVFEAWSSPGGTHSMPYEEADILKYFGLNVAGGADPEPDCPAGGSSGGTAGMGGIGGMLGVGGAPGAAGMLGVGGLLGGGGFGMGMSGTSSMLGSSGMRATAGSGGSGGHAVGIGGTGGTLSSGSGGNLVTGSGGTGGTTSSGGKTGTGGASSGASSGNGATKEPTGGSGDESSGGCSVVTGEARSRSSYLAALGFGLALLRFRRRERRAKKG